MRSITSCESIKTTMIARIWHGWTTLGNADKYESLLKEEIFVGIVFRIGAFQDSKVSNYCVGRPRLCFLIRWMLFPEFAGENYAVVARERESSPFSL